MRMISLQTGQLEDVPDDQIASAWGTTHGFDPSLPVPIRTGDGDLIAAKPTEVEAHLRDGGEFSTLPELRAAQLEEAHGGLLGTTAAAVEGVGRGLSLGLTDPLAIKAADAYGGKEAADKVRTHLAEEKEAHPWAAGAGEIAGAALPILATEGGAAPEEAAIIGGERLAAREGLSAATALRVTPAGMSARAGMAAERAATHVLGAPVAESALGRIATAAARHGAAGAVEGAIYGAGGQLSEDALGNHELNGEKLAAAIGHGALYGLLLGAGGGLATTGAKEIAGPMLRRASPYLDKAAGEQMWKSLDSLKKYTTEADARAGGTAEIGKTLIEKLGIAEGDLRHAAQTPIELAPKIDEAVQKQGGEIAEFLKSHGAHDASIDTDRIIGAIDEVIDPLRKKALHEPVVASLEEAKASLLHSLGVDEATQGMYSRARLYAEGLGHEAGSAEFAAARSKYVADHLGQMATAGMPLPKIRVGFTELLEQRKALDQMAYVEARALNPKMRVEQLREMRGKIAALEVDAIDSQAKRLGLSETAKADYLKLKKDYQRLSIAQDAANETTARMATNRNLSLTDTLAGVVPGVHALLAGHPMAAVMGLASSYGHRYVRQHGNALAAATLTKIARMDLIARAINQVDREIDQAAATLAGKPKAKLRLRRFNGPDHEESADTKWEHAYRQGSKDQVVTTEHVDRLIPALSQHAPKTTAALVRTLNAGAIYQAATRPQPLNGPTLADPLPKPRVSMVDAEQHYQRVRASQDPLGTLVDGIASGRLTKNEVDAIRGTAPALLEDAKKSVLGVLSKPRKDPLSDKQVRMLSVLFDGPGDATMTPEARRTFQAAYGPPPKQAPAPGTMAPSKMRPIEGVADASKTQLQLAQART